MYLYTILKNGNESPKIYEKGKDNTSVNFLVKVVLIMGIIRNSIEGYTCVIIYLEENSPRIIGIRRPFSGLRRSSNALAIT